MSRRFTPTRTSRLTANPAASSDFRICPVNWRSFRNMANHYRTKPANGTAAPTSGGEGVNEMDGTSCAPTSYEVRAKMRQLGTFLLHCQISRFQAVLVSELAR